VVVLIGPIGNLAGAAIADAVGYAPAFTAGSVLALLGTLLVVRMLDQKPVPARIEVVWKRATASS
jgi:hypothetical protein